MPLRSFRSRPKHAGFLLIEALLGAAVFSVFLSAAGLTLLRGQQDTKTGGDRSRATYHAERALEAVRSIRDSGFPALEGGPYGVAIDFIGDKKWHFSGTETISEDDYTTRLTLTKIADDWYQVKAETTWQQGNQTAKITLTTELTDWGGIWK